MDPGDAPAGEGAAPQHRAENGARARRSSAAPEASTRALDSTLGMRECGQRRRYRRHAVRAPTVRRPWGRGRRLGANRPPRLLRVVAVVDSCFHGRLHRRLLALRGCPFRLGYAHAPWRHLLRYNLRLHPRRHSGGQRAVHAARHSARSQTSTASGAAQGASHSTAWRVPRAAEAARSRQRRLRERWAAVVGSAASGAAACDRWPNPSIGPVWAALNSTT